MGIKKRGVFFSMDALIALIIILSIILLIIPLRKQTTVETSVHSDIIKTLSTLKIGELNNPYVQSLISQGIINNTNKSVLEQIGETYSQNVGEAQILSQNILNSINTTEKNIGIWYGEDLLASKNITPIEQAKNIDTTRQIISGVLKGNPTEGFVAKAWLKKIQSKDTIEIIKGELICGGWKTHAWGEYCGNNKNNTINYTFTVPENAEIKNAFWLAEPSWVGQNTSLSINNIKIYEDIIDLFVILNLTSYVNPGENTATLSSKAGTNITSGGEDGASHIVIEYSTPDLQTFQIDDKYPFYETIADGILHSEKSIFTPEPITKMEVHLNVTRNTKLEIRKGAQKILVGVKTVQGDFAPDGEEIIFTDAEINLSLSNAGISYSQLNSEYITFIISVGQSSQIAEIKENSYVLIESTPLNIPFGSIDLTQEIPLTNFSDKKLGNFYRNLEWTFYLPPESIPILADWQLGWISSNSTEQSAKANGIYLYHSPPDPYIEAFSRFGYTPQKEPLSFIEGKNNFTLEFGNGYGVSSEASYGSLVYFVKSFVNFGDAKPKAKGSTRTITFEDDTTQQITIGDSSDPLDSENDAVDDAVDRLLTQLDADVNGKIDLILNQDSFEIDTLDISGVPFLWSTEVQIRVWT